MPVLSWNSCLHIYLIITEFDRGVYSLVVVIICRFQFGWCMTSLAKFNSY